MNKNCFMIASSGSSATKWVSRVLSLHPQIESWHANEETPDKSRLADVNTFSDYLSSLSLEKDCYVGTIHIDPWHGKQLKDPIENRNGKFCGLLRNPIFRINSQAVAKVKRFEPSYERYHAHLHFLLYRMPELVLSFMGENKRPLSFEIVEFAMATFRVFEHERELITIPNEQLFYYEKITACSEEFAKFVTYLCNDIDLSEQYLQQVFSLGKVNEHHDKIPMSEEDIYLTDWDQDRRDIFDNILAHFESKYNIRERYRKVGFSFEYQSSNLENRKVA